MCRRLTAHTGGESSAGLVQLDEDHPFRLAQREDMRALAVTLLEVPGSLATCFGVVFRIQTPRASLP